MSDLRTYINPQPKGTFTKRWQEEYLPTDAETYTENKDGKIIDALIRSVRPGTVVVVRRLFCLGPWKPSPKKRREIIADRVGRIKARGGVILEAETQRRTDVKGALAAMLMGAYEDVATAGRSTSKGKTGRPGKNRTEADKAIMQAEWQSRKNKTAEDAIVKITNRGIPNVTRGELYRVCGTRN